MQISNAEEEEDVLKRKIEYITPYNSKAYYRSALVKLSQTNP